jgi:hypothetical protein
VPKDACAGYVIAIAESLDDLATHVPEAGDIGDACVQIPRAVSVEQLIAATNRFVARNPQLWHEMGHVLVVLPGPRADDLGLARGGPTGRGRAFPTPAKLMAARARPQEITPWRRPVVAGLPDEAGA